MQYLITHRTHYDYGDVVPECFNLVRLSPRPLSYQTTLKHELLVDPLPGDTSHREDGFGNKVEHFCIHKPHSELTVVAKNLIEVAPPVLPKLAQTPSWETVVNVNAGEDLEAVEYRFPSKHIRCCPQFAAYARQSFADGRPVAEAALDLTRRIFDDFEFDPAATTVSTPVEEVFKTRAGVCQDFAHLQIALLRSLNIPARYVSGYLRTLPPPGKPRLIGADASHAWVSVFCGQAGWIDFDPTNNVIPNTDHITIAWGRDYSDVCPIQGVYTGGGVSTLTVEVDVLPENEFE